MMERYRRTVDLDGLPRVTTGSVAGYFDRAP